MSKNNVKKVSLQFELLNTYYQNSACNLSYTPIFSDEEGTPSFTMDGKVPEERIEWLRQLWDAAHRSVKDICRDAGMTQRALAEHFAIPLHTVNNWCMEIRTCPAYTRMMMQESLGLFNRQCPV